MFPTLAWSKWDTQEATLTHWVSMLKMIDKGENLTQPNEVLVQNMIKEPILTQLDGGSMQEITNRGKSHWSLHS